MNWRRLLCWLGIHDWTSIIQDGVYYDNQFSPEHYTFEIDICQRCALEIMNPPKEFWK